MSLLLAFFVLAGEPDPPAPLLPLVEVDWPVLRKEVRELLTHLDTLKAPLPAKTAREIRAILEDDKSDPVDASRAVQQLLDAHCLVSVSVNPESRVKPRVGHARLSWFVTSRRFSSSRLPIRVA